MIVTCQKCNSNFKLDDNLVKPTGSTVRCSTCRNVFVIYKEKSTVTEEQDDFMLPEGGNVELAGVDFDVDKDLEKDFESDDDMDLSDIQVDFDDLDLPDMEDEEEPALSEDSGDLEDDLDLSDIKIDFDDEPKADDEDFELPDMDSDFDLPDMDDENEIDPKDIELEEDLSDFDLDEIAGEIDTKIDDDEDIDFDLSLDDDNDSLSLPDMDEKSDKENFLDATDYDQDSDWDVDSVSADLEKEPKKRGCLFILFFMILFAGLAAGGMYFAVKKQYLDLDKVKLPDFINSVFDLDKMGKAKLTIAPYNSSNLSYKNNKNENQICVIEGKLKNNYKEPRKEIKVVGKLLDADKKILARSEVYCGNIIADIDLANLTRAEIKKRLSTKNGSNDIYKDGVAPGDNVSFMIVFFDLPEKMKNFSVEAVSSTK